MSDIDDPAVPLPPRPPPPARPRGSYRKPRPAPAARRAFTMHDRLWKHNRYVYPVVSRRSKGISLGINLNPDKLCNFDCIYCQVDRRSEAETDFVDLHLVLDELRH